MESLQLRYPQHIGELPQDCAVLHILFGADISRRDNLHLVDSNVIVYTLGNVTVFHNITTQAKTYVQSMDTAGIGCVCIHPNKDKFAVGGKGFQPRIFIYSYPDMKIQKILLTGAEKGYASISFNSTGDRLVSVSTAPDYMLTVWDWENERIVLHSKAFGQDVFSAKFSLDAEGRLTTSGTGHIRFWKMASTFTGQKLQGLIGKFGKVELSDIAAFEEFPDGKVLSGTESGAMLLWEGNFIKSRFVRPHGKLCHRGEITYLNLDREEKCVISAGIDGSICFWNFNEINTSEALSDNSMDVVITPLAEYSLGEGIGIKALVDTGRIESDSSRSFVILDTKGRSLRLSLQYNEEHTTAVSIIRSSLISNEDDPGDNTTPVNQPQYSLSEVCHYHAGAITGMDTCPAGHIAATCGVDGAIKIWDYVRKVVIDSYYCLVSATCLRWVPLAIDRSGRSFIVGFNDGTIRCFMITKDSSSNAHVITLVKAYKPHNASVTDIGFSTPLRLLYTSGKDGIVFVLRYGEHSKQIERGGEAASDLGVHDWDPLLFVTVVPDKATGQHPVYCEHISVHHSSEKILISCNDGVCREIEFVDIASHSNASDEEIESYERIFPIKDINIQIVKVSTVLGSPVAALSTTNGGATDAADITPEIDQAAITPIDTTTTNDGQKEQEGATSPINAANTALLVTEEEYLTPKVQVATYVVDNHPVDMLLATDSATCQLLECTLLSSKPIHQLQIGNFSADGKTADRTPVVTVIRYSPSKKFILTGASDGSFTIRPVGYPNTYLKLNGHGNTVGGVSCIASSFDDNFLLTAGRDGVLVVNRIETSNLVDSSLLLTADIESGSFGTSIVKPFSCRKDAPSYLDVVSTTDETVPGFDEIVGYDFVFIETPDAVVPVASSAVDDIDSSAYSIQDAKLKSELDAKRLVAEDLKTKVRAAVKHLRDEYNYILAQNLKIPPEVRLTEKELEVDTDYIVHLSEEGVKMVGEVHKESAYDLEKSEALCRKLQSRLRENLLVEEMPLRSLDPEKKRIVYSLRVRGIDERVHQLLDAIEVSVKMDQIAEAKKWAAKAAQKKAAKTLDDMQKRVTKKDSGNGGIGGGVGGEHGDERHTYTSAAARRDMRKQRKSVLDKHTQEKPNKEDDDIQDIEAIQSAQRTLGDYKLKCADEYEVPEHQRINAQQKKRQLALLEESTVTMRLRFNQRFMNMRQLKRQMIYNILKDNARIREINEELKEDEKSSTLWEPQFDPLEYPDDRFEVTPQELAEYATARKIPGATWRDTRAPINQTITGLKTYIYNDQSTGRWTVSESPTATAADPSEDDGSGESNLFASNSSVLTAFLSTRSVNEAKRLALLEATVPCLMLAKASMKSITWLDRQEEEALMRMKEGRRQALMHERKMLLAKTASDVVSFDTALDELRLDRRTILSDLKLAELKLLVLYQEYELLLTFEGKDIALQQKQLNCQKDKAENIANINEYQGKLNVKSEDLKQWTDKIHRIQEEYREAIEGHPCGEVLGKIFRKKIKRAKTADGEESDEDYDDDDDDYDEDEDNVEDVCPPGCELGFFDSVIDMRSRRLDAEDSMSEVQKRIDELKKTIDRLKQREKQIDKDLKGAGAEIQQFQQQKQAALNKIDVVVPLCLSQLYTFETSGQLSGPREVDLSKLGKDEGFEYLETNGTAKEEARLTSENRVLVSSMTMQSHVLIKQQVLNRLKERVHELIMECNEARLAYRSLHKDRSRLEKLKDTELEKIEALNTRATSLQMHKFGRTVDLDTLEGDGADNKEDPAELAARTARNQNIAQVEELEKNADKLKDQLADVTKVNTELLRKISALLEEKAKIVTDLRAPGIDVLQDNSSLMQEEEAESARMIQLVSKQAKDIEIMKAEVLSLKRKEGVHLVPDTLAATPPALLLHSASAPTGLGLILKGSTSKTAKM